MSARRPRVIASARASLKTLLSEAEHHDVNVLDTFAAPRSRARVPARRRRANEFFVAVRDAAGQLRAQKLKKSKAWLGYPVDCRLRLDVTDQYADAYDTFADVRAWFGESSRYNLVMELSPRDAGVLRMLGGRPLPPAVNCLIVDCEPDADGGYLIVDQYCVDDVFGSEFATGLDYFGFELSTPGDMRPLHEYIGRTLWRVLMPCGEVRLSEAQWAAYCSSPTPLAEHWRPIADDGRPCERAAEAVVLVECIGRQRYFQGPESRLVEQLRLIEDAAGLLADERCVATSEQHALCEHPHCWHAVSRRIVHAAAALAQLEPRLPPYVLLWIVDRLPGCVYYPELRKLRCVEATAARIRARLDSTTK